MMGRICQKSVCTALALGIVKRKVGYLRDIQNKRVGWFLDPDGESPDPIIYCPYCGTHLIEIHDIPVVQRTATRAPRIPLVAPVTGPQPVTCSVNGVNGVNNSSTVMNDLSWMPPPPKWGGGELRKKP